MCVLKTIISFIYDEKELKECGNIFKNSVKMTFQECLKVTHNLNVSNAEINLFKVDSLIDYLHDDLNTGHWSEVSINIRKTFTVCSFLKAYVILFKDNNLIEALKCIDLGLLLGAPLDNNPDLLLSTASLLNKQIHGSKEVSLQNCSYKRKIVEFDSISNESSKKIDVLKCPSLEKFDKEYFKLEIPAKLQDCMNHWPAMKKWEDMNYLLSVAGERTVPVEIGINYTDENWGQKLMTLRSFIECYFLENSETIGYLAQHNLFDQISELKNDIHIPEYCCLSRNYEESCEPDINAWLGPANTVSPCHFDPKDNILAQVFGTKHIILFSPKDTEYLYPHEDKLLFNTSRVNPIKPDLNLFPNFKKTTMYECILKPGEFLYIPSKWWHHITALDKSFSVSFWWK